MVFKPMEESTYVANLKIVGWRLIKAGIDYSLLDEKGSFVCTIKISHGKGEKREVTAFCTQKTQNKFIPIVIQESVWTVSKLRGSTISKGGRIKNTTPLADRRTANAFTQPQTRFLNYDRYKERGLKWPPQKKSKTT